MSLLMEALKKAERAKQAAQEGGDPVAGEEGLQLAPDDPAATGGDAAHASAGDPSAQAGEDSAPAAGPNPLLRDPRAGRVDFPRLELESIGDHEFELDPPVRSRVPRPTATPEAEERGRATARTVFDAKNAEMQAESASRMPWLIGLLVLVLLAGGGGYWWIQKQFGTSSLITPQLAASGQLTQPATIRPAPVIVQVTPAPVAAAAPASAAPTPAGSTATAPLQSPGIAIPAVLKPAPDSLEPAPVISASRVRPAGSRAAGGERKDAAAVRVSPSTTTVNTTLDHAYRAYLAGDLAAAKSGYSVVLASDPENRDALLGLAGAAAREKRLEDAEGLYLRILHTDPADTVAQTGLIAIRGQADPTASESRLKNLIAGQPNAAYLHYALGNLYARAGRWNEAQQEHFRATTLDADNPDYCYNLAVSLDQIRQPQLALTHYQRALALSANRPASFDPSQLRARISELQR